MMWYLRPVGRTQSIWLSLAILVPACSLPVRAQLRVVTYNLAIADPEGNVTTARPDTDIVLKAIGEETRNGIAKPIDVLLLQEQYLMTTSTQSVVDVLNGIYGAGTYARGNVNGATSDSMARAGRPGVIYNTQTVQLIQEVQFGVVGGTSQARATLRYRFRPVGYDAEADFYAYNDHYKAGTTATDETRRNFEANSIRTNATYGSNALGEGAHAIYAGDHNIYRSSEAAFQTLISAGAGQANDPMNRIGSWTNSSSYADVHTQSPCLSATGNCGVGGGVDDRFDLQLVTGEFMDGEGLSYIGPTVPGMSGLAHSYHPFGNNGTTFNNNINAAANTVTFPGLTSYTKSQILNALQTVTDHLPVVADYQLPAVMSAVADSIPSVMDFGQLFNLNVTVSNAANVVAAIGADELDYSLTTAGSVTGSYLNQIDIALGAGNVHSLALDTSTIGIKTGTITVMSTSQGVQNGTINIPVNFLVVLAGDYNGDGAVDAADYVTWRETDGQSVAAGTGADGDRNGLVDSNDYDVWLSHFGQTVAGAGSALAAAVPEAGTLGLLLVGGCLLSGRRITLRAWTRRN